MLVPAVDLMGGKIVQLVQGEQKALEFSDPEPWIERFTAYPLIHLIDLDAAKRQGDNGTLVQALAKRLPCQVGGGIRTVNQASALLDHGAKAVILGSVLLSGGEVNVKVASEFEAALGKDRLIFAVDAKHGKVSTDAWRISSKFSPIDMMKALEPWCGAFLYTHVDGEGLMQGMPFEMVLALRAATQRRLFVAGGIRSDEEVATLHALGVDAVVGMALYSGKLKSITPPR